MESKQSLIILKYTIGTENLTTEEAIKIFKHYQNEYKLMERIGDTIIKNIFIHDGSYIGLKVECIYPNVVFAKKEDLKDLVANVPPQEIIEQILKELNEKE